MTKTTTTTTTTTWLITGANRGIGLEFVRQAATSGERALAVCRTTSPALRALAKDSDGRVVVVDADIGSDAGVDAVAAAVAGAGGVDIVVNNAAANPRHLKLGAYSRADMLATYAINSVAPVLLTQALAPVLRARTPRARVLNIGTQVGSFSWNQTGSSPLYAASKAALHMATRTLARELPELIVVVAHPGWVQTDMGGPSAPLTPAQSVTQLRALCARLVPADSGQFFNVDGQPHAW